MHTRTVRKCDFDFLTKWFYPVFRKTIFTGHISTSIVCKLCKPLNQSNFGIYWPVNRWTGQYRILAYTTWRDLNQSQPHISIRGITIWRYWPPGFN